MPDLGRSARDGPIRARVHRWWSAYHWWVLAGSALVSVVLGVVGFRSFLGAGERPFADVVYLSLQLFVLESGSISGPAPWTLELARFLAPAVGASAVAALVARIARDELVGLRTRFRRDHVIVCGLGMGAALARQLTTQGTAVVVIESDGAHPAVEDCHDRRIPVLVGDPRDEHLLRKAGVRRARQLFVVTPKDAVNIKVAEQVRRLATAGRRRIGRESAEPLRVLVHVADAELAALLAARELGRTDSGAVRLDFFDVHTSGARTLLGRYALATTPRADGRAHLAVIGLGRLGTRLVVQAGRNWLADGRAEDDRRLLFTVADVDAADKVRWLLQRHPFLSRTCEFRPVDLPPDPGGLVDRSLFSAPGRPPLSCVFVCWPDDAQGLGVAIALDRSLDGGTLIILRVYDRDLAAVVPAGAPSDRGLHVFDQVERTCRPDEILAGAQEQLARSFHDAYRRQRIAAGDTPGTNRALTTWDLLADDKKESNRAQAEQVGLKMAAIGCSITPLSDPHAELFRLGPDELEVLSEMEHRRWCEAAPAADHDNVPWAELPDDRREIDRVFVRRLPALLASVGLQIERDSRCGPDDPTGRSATAPPLATATPRDGR